MGNLQVLLFPYPFWDVPVKGTCKPQGPTEFLKSVCNELKAMSVDAIVEIPRGMVYGQP
jgi:hypothetical protein